MSVAQQGNWVSYDHGFILSVAGCACGVVAPVSSEESSSENPRAGRMFRHITQPLPSAHVGVCARFQLKEELASKATELADAAAATAALERRMAEEEEERRNAHTSVMRLEAQVMNRLTYSMHLSDYFSHGQSHLLRSLFWFSRIRVSHALTLGVCPR